MATEIGVSRITLRQKVDSSRWSKLLTLSFLFNVIHARIAFLPASRNLVGREYLQSRLDSTSSPISSSSATPSTSTNKGVEHPFLDVQLRGAAMKLHTRSQSPKEGQAPEQTKEPYVPTRMDYLQFLVDSQCVYNAMETIVRLPHLQPQLQVFHSTGLERVQPLEEDIKYMMETYQLIRPIIGQAGRAYEAFLMDLVSDSKNQSSSVTIPRFICHYYNYYFAHTAGGRMIGKQMSALLLDKVTLKFYQWEQGDVNVLKTVVKDNIENLAQTFTDEQKLACEEETANAFRYAGAINMYLSGGGNHH